MPQLPNDQNIQLQCSTTPLFHRSPLTERTYGNDGSSGKTRNNTSASLCSKNKGSSTSPPAATTHENRPDSSPLDCTLRLLTLHTDLHQCSKGLQRLNEPRSHETSTTTLGSCPGNSMTTCDIFESGLNEALKHSEMMLEILDPMAKCMRKDWENSSPSIPQRSHSMTNLPYNIATSRGLFSSNSSSSGAKSSPDTNNFTETLSDTLIDLESSATNDNPDSIFSATPGHACRGSRLKERSPNSSLPGSRMNVELSLVLTAYLRLLSNFGILVSTLDDMLYHEHPIDLFSRHTRGDPPNPTDAASVAPDRLPRVSLGSLSLTSTSSQFLQVHIVIQVVTALLAKIHKYIDHMAAILEMSQQSQSECHHHQQQQQQYSKRRESSHCHHHYSQHGKTLCNCSSSSSSSSLLPQSDHDNNNKTGHGKRICSHRSRSTSALFAPSSCSSSSSALLSYGGLVNDLVCAEMEELEVMIKKKTKRIQAWSLHIH